MGYRFRVTVNATPHLVATCPIPVKVTWNGRRQRGPNQMHIPVGIPISRASPECRRGTPMLRMSSYIGTVAATLTTETAMGWRRRVADPVEGPLHSLRMRTEREVPLWITGYGL